MINKQIVSIKYITVFQCTYYILHCFLYPFILCIFWTTDQKVTGLNPVGVTKRSALRALFLFLCTAREIFLLFAEIYETRFSHAHAAATHQNKKMNRRQ